MVSQKSLLSMDLNEEKENTKIPSLMEQTPPYEIQWALNNVLRAIDTQQNDIIKTSRSVNEPITGIESCNSQDKQQFSTANTEIEENSFSPQIQENYQILDNNNATNVENEKIQINTVLKNSKTSSFEKFQNMDLPKNSVLM